MKYPIEYRFRFSLEGFTYCEYAFSKPPIEAREAAFDMLYSYKSIVSFRPEIVEKINSVCPLSLDVYYLHDDALTLLWSVGKHKEGLDFIHAAILEYHIYDKYNIDYGYEQPIKVFAGVELFENNYVLPQNKSLLDQLKK